MDEFFVTFAHASVLQTRSQQSNKKTDNWNRCLTGIPEKSNPGSTIGSTLCSHWTNPAPHRTKIFQLFSSTSEIGKLFDSQEFWIDSRTYSIALAYQSKQKSKFNSTVPYIVPICNSFGCLWLANLGKFEN